MSRARKRKPSPEFERWARTTTRYDAWQEHRGRFATDPRTPGALAPSLSAMQPPDGWEPPADYSSPRVERKRRRRT